MGRTRVATRGGGPTTITAEELQALADELEGRLLFPEDEAFEDATRLWNGMIDKQPALVAQPTGAGDVQRALAFAREHELALSVRGGGHNIAGTALVDGGLTIDMSQMREVTVDPEARTATAQGGCLLADVDEATQAYGMVTPLGFVSETGLAGLTLGGGFGYLTRRFGWTVDNLRAVEIVTADGQVRAASREEDPDLFWALRGAGHNLGVVTEFTFDLHDLGPEVYGGLVAWPADRKEEILAAYRRITEQAPRELTVFCLMRRAPPAPFVPEEWHGERIAAMVVCYSGELDGVDDALAPIRGLGEPIVDILAERSYLELQSLLDATQPKGNHYYWKTEFADELAGDLLDEMAELSEENPIPGGQLIFAHIGGALNELAGDDGAVGNREARYVYGIAGMWEPEDPGGDKYRAWVREAWRRIRGFSVGNYVNFQTADEGEQRLRETYGENFERVREVEERYDPANVFQQNR